MRQSWTTHGHEAPLVEGDLRDVHRRADSTFAPRAGPGQLHVMTDPTGTPFRHRHRAAEDGRAPGRAARPDLKAAAVEPAGRPARRSQQGIEKLGRVKPY